MKEVKKMWILIVEVIIGVVIAVIGWNINNDYYMSLVFASGFGLAFSAAAQIIRIIYWNNPKHEQEYEMRKQEAHINAVDERKRHIREKTGYITYQIMTVVLLILITVLAWLQVEVWVIVLMLAVFLLQCIVWTVAFHRLEKRM